MPTWMGTVKQRLRALLIILVAALVWAVLRAGAAALVPFFIGAIMVYILIPPVDFLQKHAPKIMRGRRSARILAIVLVYVVVFGLIGGLLSYVIPELISQTQQLASTVPGAVHRAEQPVLHRLRRVSDAHSRGIRSNVEEGVQTTINAVGTAFRGASRPRSRQSGQP